MFTPQLITIRDLLKWAQRMQNAGGKDENLAHEGYLLLGERLRSLEEKELVKSEIEKHTKV